MRRSFIVLGIGLLLLGGLATFFGLQFLRYRKVADRLPENNTPILVTIIDPVSGDQAEAGVPLLIQVEASAQTTESPLTSLELWADGVLVGVQSAPSSDGITPLSAGFAWTPSEPRNYSLIARATNVDKAKASSQAVWISASGKLGPQNGDEDPANMVPTANGSGGMGISPVESVSVPLALPPDPPGPNDTVDPGNTWIPSLGDWLSQILIKTAPDAPELTAAAQGCDVTLSIHDWSNNEEGFFVYRQLAGESSSNRIATLGPASGNWLTHADNGHSGLVTYYAAAFNSKGEAAGNLASVQVDPAACPVKGNLAPVLTVHLSALTTDLPVDQIYCYKSLGGIDWSRWPASGFFIPGPNGFDVQGQGESLLVDNLGNSALPLDLECWGWVGGSLQLLDKFHEDNVADPGRLGNLGLQGDHLQLGIDLSRGDGIQIPGANQPQPDPPKAPTDPLMPIIFADKQYGVDNCKPHTPSKGASGWENFLYCTQYPENTKDKQPYLVWWTADQSCPDCRPLSWYVQQAETYGGKVGFKVYAHPSNYTIPSASTKIDDTVWVLPPLSECGDYLDFRVRMYFTGGPNDPLYPNETIESQDSNTAHYIYNCPPPSEVKLDVTFDSLHIGDIYDGPFDDDLELYGSLVAEGIPGSGSVLNFGKWGENGPDCEDLDAPPILPTDFIAPLRTLGSGGTELPECPRYYYSGMNDPLFAATSMCTSDTYAHCNGGYSTQNNVIHVTVGNGSKLRVSVHIVDYDANSLDDTACQTQAYIGPESNYSWMSYSGNGTLSHGDNGNASCVVYFHVNPTP